jgi:hypothetical protein
MKVVVALLVLSTSIVASAAIARDARGFLHDNLTYCSQFLIHDPDPRLVLGYMRDCCAHGRSLRDCRVHDWDTTDWGIIER